MSSMLRAVLILALLLVVLLELMVLWVGSPVAPHYAVDLRYKEPDTQLEFAGFYIPEANAEFPYRWSQPYAFIQLPNAAHLAGGYIASFTLRVPNQEAVRPVTLLVNEQPQTQFLPSAGFRHYSFALPAPDDIHGLRVALSTAELRLPGDVRPLGLVFTDAALRPILAGRPELALLAALGMLLVAGLTRYKGRQHQPMPRRPVTLTALAAAAILGCGLLGMLVLARPTALSLPVLFVFAILGACAALLATAQAAARLALIALTQLVVCSAALWPAWLTDDAFISFRYAQNLAQGHGLVYNLGERVEGYTNFLWTLLAALVLRLGGDIVWWAYAAGMTLGLLIVLLSFKLGAALLGEAWGLVAALFVATSQALLIYTARGAGLETGLFTLLVLAGVYAFVRPRIADTRAPGHVFWTGLTKFIGLPGWSGHPITPSPRHLSLVTRHSSLVTRHSSLVTRHSSPRHPVAAGLLLALATLTRPEGALIFAICFGFVLLNAFLQRQSVLPQQALWLRQIALLLGSYVLLVLPYFLWRLSYYGDPLPNTFYAKTGGGTQAMLRGLEYAGDFALAMGGPLLLFILVPVLSKTRAAILERILGWPGLLLVICLVYTLYIVRVGGDHFPGYRFFVPLVPLLALLMAAGIARSYDVLQNSLDAQRREQPSHSQRQRSLLRDPRPLLLALVLLCSASYTLLRSPELNQVVQGSDENLRIWQELGWWLADHGAGDESIAVMSAGAIAFYSEHTSIDMLGLTDLHIGRLKSPDFGSGPAGHEKRDPAYVLHERQPSYIPRWWEDYFGGPEALRSLYKPVTITTRYGRVIELWQRR